VLALTYTSEGHEIVIELEIRRPRLRPSHVYPEENQGQREGEERPALCVVHGSDERQVIVAAVTTDVNESIRGTANAETSNALLRVDSRYNLENLGIKSAACRRARLCVYLLTIMPRQGKKALHGGRLLNSGSL
jgi:hypothetical protein